MSRAAYESYFSVSAPIGSYFGVDVSWWQGAGVYTDTLAYWRDQFIKWCSFVCIRTSFGASGDDGNQASHFQAAHEVGYPGEDRSLGTYHYVVPSSGLDGNFDNYIARSDPYVDQTDFDMLDFEEGPNPGASAISTMHDKVEQRRQRTCFLYGGKTYWDSAGALSVAAERLWEAHWPSKQALAWQPTTSWEEWGAPLMPDQFAPMPKYPGVWQWSSSAIGQPLDLDMSTSPKLLGIGELPVVTKSGLTAEEHQMLTDIATKVSSITGADYNLIRGIVRDELSKLHLQQGS